MVQSPFSFVTHSPLYHAIDERDGLVADVHGVATDGVHARETLARGFGREEN
jgi:hypothetical protein